MNAFSEKILKAAEEGIVLLRNKENVLPLTSNDCVSVFGRIQHESYRCGTGSGGSVHVPYVTNFTEILFENAKKIGFKVNEKNSKIYEDFINENPFDNGGGGWAAEPYLQKDLEISKELVNENTSSNKVIYVIGRTAGEDKDYKKEEGSWYLTKTEKKNIQILCENFENVIIVLNTSGIIDTSWQDDKEFNGKIKSIIYVWEGGQESGRAAANVVSGLITPSGKLTDTIAKIEDYISTENFAKKEAFYKEDIFVGYRYFNTFAKEKIIYPFGFGLSYTTFKLSEISAENKGTKVNIKVKVTNNGKTFGGKEIVQAYISAPQQKLSKPEVELVAFAKTKELKPNESEILEMDFDLEDFASYDDSGITGFEFCKVLEKGEYNLFVGTDSLSLNKIKISEKNSIIIEETYSIEKLEQAAAPLVDFERLVAGKKCENGNREKLYENVPKYKINIEKRINDNLPKEISYTGNKGITFDDLKNDRTKLNDFVAQLNVKELATIVRGEGMVSRKVTEGIASAFGGVSEALYNYKIPCAGCADGPAGLRLDNGDEASLMPIGTQLACSWNLTLVRELYEEEGKELHSKEIDALLGPGINIHRNPLNGRNFEYFSEDPYLTGLMAKAQIKGLYDGGSNATIKHFALNSQETFRRTSDSIVSERAMREIYLKPFEMAVKDNVVKSIMTSYNRINGHWAAGNYDLVNTILRKQWNYKGLVMTDWWAGMNDCINRGESSVKNMSFMIRSRGDVYMVVDNDGAEKNVYGDDIESSLKNGTLKLSELQVCAKDIINFLLDAPVSKRELRPLNTIKEYEPLTENLSNNKKLLVVNEHFVPKVGEEFFVKVEKEEIFGVSGIYCKAGDNLSQSVSNIFINGKSAASFECRTTKGESISKCVDYIKLKKGLYKIEIKHIKPGIEIQDLVISTTAFSPVTAGHFQ